MTQMGDGWWPDHKRSLKVQALLELRDMSDENLLERVKVWRGTDLGRIYRDEAVRRRLLF